MWPGFQDRAEAAVAPLAMMILSLNTDESEAQGSGSPVSAMMDQSLDHREGGSG